MEFKDYKEKQRYYEERSKDSKLFWISCDPLIKENLQHKKIEKVVKGRTYVKPKEGDKICM